MSYCQPKFNNFHEESLKLQESYKSAYEEKQKKQSSLTSIFYGKQDITRFDDIVFIERVSSHIQERKFVYDKMDDAFKNKNYNSVTAPFLKDVLTGAYFCILNNIASTYKVTNPNNSTLVSLILKTFNVENISDISSDEQSRCLNAFKRYMTVMQKKEGDDDLKWHDTISSSKLMDMLTLQIASMPTTQVGNSM